MTFTCEICGTEYRLVSGWQIPQQSGAVSTATFTVEVDAGETPPLPYSLVVLFAEYVPFFRGYISAVSSPEYSSGYEVRKYTLSVNSAEAVLNNRLVSESLARYTATQIIQYLFDNYISKENITLGAISTIAKTYPEYNCQYQRLYDVLSDIALDNDATFYISPDNRFYFLHRNDFILMDAPAHITALSIEDESGDLRTVQIVSGATEDTTSTTEHVYWATGQSTYTLGYSVKELTGITIGGVVAGVGILGVDESDTTKTFLYKIGSNIITLNKNATTKPTAGQLVDTVYVGMYDIGVTETNEALKAMIAARSGTSGIIEQQYSDETLAAYASADAKALDLLAAYNATEQTVSCIWRGDTLEGSELLTMWTLNYPEKNISGQFAIVERSITNFSVNKIEIVLTLKNKNYFRRYGTVFTAQKKQPMSEIKVYKNATITESASASEQYIVDSGDFVFYPTDGTDFNDPNFIDNFYPGF